MLTILYQQTVVSFANPTGSIISIGDNLYAYPAAPAPTDVPVLGWKG